MKKLKELRIIFMGTPPFAVASLSRLLEAGCNIISVITAPDKPAGRGLSLQQSAVKEFAVKNNLPVLQPEKLKDPAFIEKLKELNVDLQVVVAFRMLPEVVWNMPPMGTINVHGSLLPQYRGAAPINWAIINGEKETGITTFKLQHAIDTGDILLKATLPIGENETAGELHDRMKEIGADLLLETLKQVCDNNIRPIPQQMVAGELKHAPKINAQTCLVDWKKPVDEIFDLVRGLSPVPAAFTYLDGKKLKIFTGSKTYSVTSHSGEIESDGKNLLRFGCSDGWLNILELQLEGKKKMPVADFLRGYRIN